MQNFAMSAGPVYDALILAAVQKCRGGTAVKQALVDLQKAATTLSSLLGDGNDVYCMVSISASPEEKQVLYPAHAPVLMSALSNSNWGSSIACSVVPDALSVVRKLSRRNNDTNTVAVRSSSIPTQPATILSPSWLNRDYMSGKARNGANDSLGNPMYALCGDDLMSQLNSVESYALSNIYRAFFNKNFCEAKRMKAVSGPLNYKLLTPP